HPHAGGAIQEGAQRAHRRPVRRTSGKRRQGDARVDLQHPPALEIDRGHHPKAEAASAGVHRRPSTRDVISSELGEARCLNRADVRWSPAYKKARGVTYCSMTTTRRVETSTNRLP